MNRLLITTTKQKGMKIPRKLKKALKSVMLRSMDQACKPSEIRIDSVDKHYMHRAKMPLKVGSTCVMAYRLLPS